MKQGGRALRRGSTRGAGPWWAQRVTAMALAPLGAWLLIVLLSPSVENYAAVRMWMTRGLNPVLLTLFILVAAEHSCLGLQEIVDDYVGDVGTRTAMRLAIRIVHWFAAAGAVLAVSAVAFRLLE